MIMGIGVDVVDIERFTAILERTPRLGERLFLPQERSLPPRSLAGRFAVREAVAKAVHAPPGMVWQDCCLEKNADGAPRLVVSGTVAETAARLGINRWHVSITHDGGVAVATVVAEHLSEEELARARAWEETVWQ